MPRDNGWSPPADGKASIINPTSPLTVAQQFLDLTYGDTRQAKLLRHRGVFYRWARTAWAEIGEETLRAQLYSFLAGCLRPGTNGDLDRVDPNIRLVSEVLSALKAVALIGDDIEPPAWLRGGKKERANELVAFKNGLLDLPTGELIPPTPEFFCLSALDIDWNENAPAPKRWLAFLREIWPDDQESIDALQEIFGDLLTDDTRLQKAFMLVGPPRCGKGTIGRVLRALVGVRNTVSPTLSSLGSHFGRASLIGKRLALVGDARLGRDADPIAIAEHILGITGEDAVTIPRKNLSDWTGQLHIKFVVLCTEVPKMTDDSAGIADRFKILRMLTSFLGQEDTDLTNKLLTELPGIAVWAVAGWDAVFGENGSGRITQPKSAQGHVADIRDLASDIKQYLDERCDFAPDYSIEREILYKDYCCWRAAQGSHPITKAVFGKKLRTAFPNLGDYQPGEDKTQGKRPTRHYCGLRLRP
jgi:putative DNA primase/helicase